MTDTEEYAILTAIKKFVDDELKLLKCDMNDHMLEALEIGADRIVLRVGGEKVGSAVWVPESSSITVAIPTEPKRGRAAYDELMERGLIETVSQPRVGWEGRFAIVNHGGEGIIVDTETGEECPWLDVQQTTRKGYLRTTGCKPKDVADAMQNAGIDGLSTRFLLGGE